MQVKELIEKLSALPPETEVRIATQPTYPIATNVEGVYMQGFTDYYGEEIEEPEEGEEPKVWLVEGSLPYDENPYSVPRDAFEVM